jgi:hypothetical protein
MGAKWALQRAMDMRNVDGNLPYRGTSVVLVLQRETNNGKSNLSRIPFCSWDGPTGGLTWQICCWGLHP